ncbi:MAG: DNA polymerase III subunit beta [bacterium]
MKIICTKENLVNALTSISGVANKSINLPILNNVLIRAEEQKVVLVATNLELAVTCQLRAKVEKAGSFTVPAKTLGDYVNLLPEETVEMELKENELVIMCGKSATKIKGTPAEEFPVVPSVNEGMGYLLDSENLKKSLDQVNQSAAKNDIRPELAGISFNFNGIKPGTLVMVATDSYRLAEKKIDIKQGEEQIRVIVPIRTAQEINRILILNKNIGSTEKDIRLILSDNQIVLRNNDIELVSRLVEGQYPDYTQIIPKDFKTTCSLSVNQITKEVKAASLFTTVGVNAVNFNFKPDQGSLSVASSSAQAGEYLSEVEAEITGEQNSILLNHRYILDGLNNLEKDVCEIRIVNSDSPCVFSAKGDDSYLYIVMPIRQ